MDFTGFGCRFCLRTIQSNEKFNLIDEDVKSQFITLTQIELDIVEGLSKFVCEVCLRSVQLATALKLQFVENQKKLLAEIDDYEIEPTTSNIAIHDIQETTNDELKPMTKFHSIPIQKAVTVKSIPKKPPAKKLKTTQKIPDNISDNSLSIQDTSSSAIDPEIKIKEEKIEEGEIQIKHEQFYDQFDYSQSNTFDENDSDDPSSMLEEMDTGTEQYPNTPDHIQQKVYPRKTITGEKVYPCVYCGKHYAKRHLTRHINAEHKKTKFQCMVAGCTNTYSRKEKLRGHIQTKHIDCTQEEYDNLLEQIKHLMPIYEDANLADLETPKMKFYCVVPGCQANYTRKRKLKLHLPDKHANLTPKEMAAAKRRLDSITPVYEMYKDPVVNPEDIIN
ncbi:uncharacterized protein [Chironomus tepperi]|uniref:uncharacterized protein n=1 Tax=Chironomus tepperi TaxID=113505 RepID=UPI00391F5CB2